MKPTITLLALALLALTARGQQAATDIKLTPTWERGSDTAIAIRYMSAEDYARQYDPEKIVITQQEARDVVRAMEILKRAAGLITWSGSFTTTMQITPGKISGVAAYESARELRARADQIEAEERAVEQNRKDMIWAESVLESWRKKVEAIK